MCGLLLGCIGCVWVVVGVYRMCVGCCWGVGVYEGVYGLLVCMGYWECLIDCLDCFY